MQPLNPLVSPAICRVIRHWLILCAALVVVMVGLGGVTRLTESGLSIVEWKPISGVLPPLTTEAWEETFHKYKQTPEYQKVNQGMSLEGFQAIFWMEYLHRLLGRIIGVVFALPFFYFTAAYRLPKAMIIRLFGILLLGGLQGGIGWYMVKSGLVDRPDVSQYRLSLHLVTALCLYVLILWHIFSLKTPDSSEKAVLPCAWKAASIGLVLLVLIQSAIGALVAGLDAGLVYNTLPLMDGQLMPKDVWDHAPWYLNFFENPVMVQFMHRIGALIVACYTAVYVVVLMKKSPFLHAKKHAILLMFGLAVQVVLGAITLLYQVPLLPALLHQLGAVMLLSLALWHTHTNCSVSFKKSHIT